MQWKWIDHIGSHTVHLEHDVFTGRRLIAVDGKVIFTKAYTLLDTTSSHTVMCGSTKCVIRVVESAENGYGYALLLNDQPFARFRESFWKHANLWYLPVDGKITTRRQGSGVWEEALLSSHGELNQYQNTNPQIAPATTPTAATSSSPAQSDSLTSPGAPRYHSVVVLSEPQLTVLVNGTVVELDSTFSSSDDLETESSHGTIHTFSLPKAREDGDDLICHLQVWLDDAAPVPVGHVANRVPRDKKHGRFRYALKLNGVTVSQAPSPLVGIQGALAAHNNSTATASAKDEAAKTNSNNVPSTTPSTSTQPTSSTVPQSPSKPVPVHEMIETDFGFI